MSVRRATPKDVPRLGQVAETAGLVPAKFLPGMIAPAFAGDADTWLVLDGAEAADGFAFARPEALTDRVWNLLALAVDPAAQKAGGATALPSALETSLNARLIVIATTQLPAKAAARAFYEKAGYEREGTVRDFYAAGEDKIIYRKVFE